MNSSLKYIGGARIGWVNATWPFAILTVTKDKLILNATLIGKYSFSPSEIISLEKYRFFLSWGIKIYHNVSNYPKNIVFWYFGKSQRLIDEIAKVGFIASAEVKSGHIKHGIPVRWQALVIITVLWNMLFILDFNKSKSAPYGLGMFSSIAIFLMFLGSISIWKLRLLQRALMKPGRSLNEIKPWLYLIALVTGVMSAFYFLK